MKGQKITQGDKKKMVWLDMQHFPQWKIGQRIGISQGRVSHWLRVMHETGEYDSFKRELQSSEPVTFDDDTPADDPEDVQTKMKNTGINPEFEQAVDAMIANADENSANAEPYRLPHVIRSALDDKCCEINIDIETREAQIAELKAEIRALEAQKQDIQTWMEAHE